MCCFGCCAACQAEKNKESKRPTVDTKAAAIVAAAAAFQPPPLSTRSTVVASSTPREVPPSPSTTHSVVSLLAVDTLALPAPAESDPAAPKPKLSPLWKAPAPGTTNILLARLGPQPDLPGVAPVVNEAKDQAAPESVAAPAALPGVAIPKSSPTAETEGASFETYATHILAAARKEQKLHTSKGEKPKGPNKPKFPPAHLFLYGIHEYSHENSTSNHSAASPPPLPAIPTLVKSMSHSQ